MSSEINDSQSLAEQIGELVQPSISKLDKRLKGLVGAQLCSLDGFNICALKMGKEQVSRMAAASSSLFSISDFVVNSFAGTASEDAEMEHLDLISVKKDDLQVIAVDVINPRGGHLVLVVAATNTDLGMMIVMARAVSTQITEVIEKNL